MFDSNSFLLGLTLGKDLDLSIEKAQSIRFYVIPPNSPSIYRLPIFHGVSLFSSITEFHVRYEDILLTPIDVFEQKFRVGYSKEQNILIVCNEGVK